MWQPCKLAQGYSPGSLLGTETDKKISTAALPFPQGLKSGRKDKYIKSNELGGGREVSVGCSERTAANYRLFPSTVERHL